MHDPSAVFSFMPTLLIGILFGLAMDYQMFLVSGMHEAYVHGKDARTAVREGFTSGARVVAAAALIMVSVFSGFIYAEMTMARSIGFGLAVGVLLDAFLVRMTFTPAVLSMLGDRAWWLPRWLDRLLPNLDVEGAALAERLAARRRRRRRSGAGADERPRAHPGGMSGSADPQGVPGDAGRGAAREEQHRVGDGVGRPGLLRAHERAAGDPAPARAGRPRRELAGQHRPHGLHHRVDPHARGPAQLSADRAVDSTSSACAASGRARQLQPRAYGAGVDHAAAAERGALAELEPQAAGQEGRARAGPSGRPRR